MLISSLLKCLACPLATGLGRSDDRRRKLLRRPLMLLMPLQGVDHRSILQGLQRRPLLVSDGIDYGGQLARPGTQPGGNNFGRIEAHDSGAGSRVETGLG